MKSIRKNIIPTICILFLICVTTSVAGQDIDHDQDHQHDVHSYHLGFGIAGAYLSGEEGLAPRHDGGGSARHGETRTDAPSLPRSP